MTKMDFFEEIAYNSVEQCYRGNRLKLARQRREWEYNTIVKYGYVDYYITAYWMFISMPEMNTVHFWGRGAMCSSVICHALGLSAVDPLRFNLHSERFVNSEPPRFQFDIDTSDMQILKDGMKEVVESDYSYFKLPPKVRGILSETSPVSYLSNRKKKRITRNLDEEMIQYALSFPDTLYLRDTYANRKDGFDASGYKPLDDILSSTRGLLVYQEQMLDILEDILGVPCLEANDIRKSIMRGESQQVEDYRKRYVVATNNISEDDAQKAWDALTSNSHAFLKSHAASRVMASQYYGVKI